MEKLSKLQSEILELMKSGYELVRLSTTRLNVRYFLQKGGVGMGGENKNVNKNTPPPALLKSCLIEVSREKFPPVYYNGGFKGARKLPISIVEMNCPFAQSITINIATI